MTTIIRLALTGALLIPVYGETGPWTVAVLALGMVANELHAVAGHPEEGNR